MLTEKAFRTGSEYPPLEPGVLRLYSMRFCPYAQRTRILLAHKNIQHEVVNIHLREKPEWYIEKICPVGQVPAIQKDDVIVYDSSIVNEYLDSVYPDNQLNPSDPYQRAKDRMFLESWPKIVKPFYKLFFCACEDKEAITELFSALDMAESELKRRNTTFFGGQNMAMIDVLLWPHAERIGLFRNISKELALDESRYPCLTAWMNAMSNVPSVKKTATNPEIFVKFVQMVKEKNVDYDIGLEE